MYPPYADAIAEGERIAENLGDEFDAPYWAVRHAARHAAAAILAEAKG